MCFIATHPPPPNFSLVFDADGPALSNSVLRRDEGARVRDRDWCGSPSVIGVTFLALDGQ